MSKVQKGFLQITQLQIFEHFIIRILSLQTNSSVIWQKNLHKDLKGIYKWNQNWRCPNRWWFETEWTVSNMKYLIFIFVDFHVLYENTHQIFFLVKKCIQIFFAFLILLHLSYFLLLSMFIHTIWNVYECSNRRSIANQLS